MTDSHEERLPGVTFWFTSATYRQATPGVHVREVRLDCRSEDEELWKEIELKLRNGLRVYAGETFHEAIIDAVKMSVAELREENEELKRQLRRERDALEQTKEELERYKGPLAAFGRALKGDR